MGVAGGARRLAGALVAEAQITAGLDRLDESDSRGETMPVLRAAESRTKIARLTTCVLRLASYVGRSPLMTNRLNDQATRRLFSRRLYELTRRPPQPPAFSAICAITTAIPIRFAGTRTPTSRPRSVTRRSRRRLWICTQEPYCSAMARRVRTIIRSRI